MSRRARHVPTLAVSLALALGGAALLAPPAPAGTAVPASDGGSVLGWGYGNLQQTAVPASLDGKTVVAISAGLNHSLALTSAGEVVGWGYDPSGQASPPAA